MTGKLTADQRAKLMRLRDDLGYFAANNLFVKSKAGKIVPFQFNRVQVYLNQRLDDQKRRTGKVRALIGKGRQGGASTGIGARFYHMTSMHKGVQTFILTHEQDATDTLFDMVERFYRYSKIKPHLGASNAKELFFSKLDSGYAVGTAGSKQVGRSKTVQLFHGSETAFWPNAATHFAGVVQTVPDLPGTEIILESTGNGIGNEFHERWQRAEAGDGDYEAIFVPWFWSDEYQREVPPDFRLDDEEAEYQAMHALSLEQMVWRRAKVSELKDPKLFRQEYPATADEMFQMTGHDGFILSEDVLRARKTVCEGIGPLVIGADPARFGDDRFSLAWRKGRRVAKIESKAKLDTVAGANWVRRVIETDKPARVFIDLGGQGAGVFDILQSWGAPYDKIVVGVNFGGSPQDVEYIDADGSKRPGPLNRRAEMWARSRDWLRAPGGADIPDLDSLQADACAPRYGYDTNQRLQIESKEHMRSRGVRSPDEWDAVCLTFAEPVRDPPQKPADRPRVMTIGSGGSSWMAS